MGPIIKSISFGQITLDEKEYKYDVIILPGEVYSPWWRIEGHNVYLQDLKKLEDIELDTVVFGTGTSDLVKVSDSVVEYLTNRGAEVIIMPTPKACEYYNKIYTEKRTAACLHLTC
ncbi:MAG: MTH938/NDUFAF3 family protein [Clostridiales bacterium]|nr:MTH938/NDUFAF3 family protein [Clostridiales bacterium]MCF8021423.1 MTH938/NDUFAF3 family protein [Clostridiales bacterium]